MPSPETPSPCLGICQLDAAADACLGCLRSLAEIGDWAQLGEAERAAIWELLPERSRRLGFGYAILPRSPAALVAEMQAALADPGQSWSVGIPGALAEFRRSPDEAAEISLAEDGGQVITARGGIRVTIEAGARLFEVAENTLAVALRQGFVPEPRRGISPLGRDGQALRREHRGQALFDLGLGHMAAFCVRTADAALADLLQRAEGRDLLAEPELMTALREAAPQRVVFTPLARIEVAQDIPQPGGASPPGPHTHLLPELLAGGHDHDPAWLFPETFAACLALYAGAIPGSPTPR